MTLVVNGARGVDVETAAAARCEPLYPQTNPDRGLGSLSLLTPHERITQETAQTIHATQ